ncbi:hypothetical protein KDI_52880 [Dictyobacter arantiisoli]|uniref:Uncharacterized protein n=1 Tax=Dictyobacter arantiisoli TaxID=2014874 RepID=A0A5A5TL87_9CHLR|nr:hypothetical protein KDI_52880 [Dictyobacter arantiisoli]
MLREHHGNIHCYDVPSLPRTNNDLEQCFGAVCHHERRATGRRGAVPGLVVRGSVRVVATLATRFCCFTPVSCCKAEGQGNDTQGDGLQ